MNSLAVNPDKTLELLWARVRQRGDMPGFSKVVSAIVGAMHGEDDREFNMTKTVLSDPTLTQRVLRLANSAMYAAFGQGINTVSKAVIVLGTETIGHLALGLKLIDGLSAASNSTGHTRSEMEKAVLAGQIARQVASSTTRRDTEEVVVCSILHSLGRLMVSFYLPDEWAEVQNFAAANQVDEDEAARQVLGLGLDEIGRSIGKRWGFPAPLIESLKNVRPPNEGEHADGPLEHTEWLAAVSTMSSRCASVLCEQENRADADLTQIAETYAEMLGLDSSTVLSAVDTAQQTVEGSVRAAKPADEEPVPEQAPSGKPTDSINILKRGVTDMRNQGMSASTGQLTTIALETVYQGLGLRRAVAFLRHHEEGKYSARMGFGEGTQELLPHLSFNDAYEPDVFHAALANDKMIFVEDARAPGFLNKLPRWWRDNLPTSRSFVVLPLMLHFHPVGFLYGDWDQSSPDFKIMPNEVVLLDELRALMVKAVEHRIKIEPAWARAMR
ncbi:MAG TPA: HDOD domain-containing protein [Oxalicibacterium sp.]|nr:HDOD domain-containing protein [Oxalicibacterium sp.]